MSLAQTGFLENLILHLLLRRVQTSWDGWILPNNNSNQNQFAFPPSCQEQVDKVVFVWVYELENNGKETPGEPFTREHLRVVAYQKKLN